jgi:hypothetical protein
MTACEPSGRRIGQVCGRCCGPKGVPAGTALEGARGGILPSADAQGVLATDGWPTSENEKPAAQDHQRQASR